MTDWLAPLEAAALGLVAGSLLYRSLVLRPAIAHAIGVGEVLTALGAASHWTLWLAGSASGAALLLAVIRLAGRGSAVGAALALLSFVGVLLWAAVPRKRLRCLERAWSDTAAQPDPTQVARVESLDRALALPSAAAALVALIDLLLR